MVGSNVSCVRSVHFFVLSVQHEMAQNQGENFDLIIKLFDETFYYF